MGRGGRALGGRARDARRGARRLGDLDAAEADCTAAIGLDRRHRGYLNRAGARARGVARGRSSRPTATRPRLARHAGAYAARAQARRHLRRLDDAEADYGRAIAASGDATARAEAHAGRASIHRAARRRGRLTTARAPS